jgi:hypothetical protein
MNVHSRVLRLGLSTVLGATGFFGCGDDQSKFEPAPTGGSAAEPEIDLGVDADEGVLNDFDYGPISFVDATPPPVFENPSVPPSTSGATTGGVESTFNHENDDLDVWDLLARLQDEGPAEYSAHVHSCPKVRYATLGRILASRGVDLDANGETSAGRMYRTGDQALGVANYGARVPEAAELTTASASKLFDLFVAAAPEMVARMPERPECTVGGVPSRIFNAQGQCDASGLTCLMGVPAQAGHLEICNRIVARASSPEIGRTLAVASLLAAAHTCE